MDRLRFAQTALYSLVLVGLVTVSCGLTERGPGTLGERDSLAVVEAIGAYVQNWKNDDTTGVLNTLGPDAVLVPAGIPPVVGRDAIRRFWWPTDGSTTKILQYDDRIEEVTGTGDMAVVRAVGRLAFRWERGDQSIENTNYNRSLTVLRKAADGRWLITHRIWGPTPADGS